MAPSISDDIAFSDSIVWEMQAAAFERIDFEIGVS